MPAGLVVLLVLVSSHCLAQTATPAATRTLLVAVEAPEGRLSCEPWVTLWDASRGGARLAGPVRGRWVAGEGQHRIAEIDFGFDVAPHRWLELALRCGAEGGSSTAPLGRWRVGAERMTAFP